MKQLTKRQQAICRLLPPCETLLDVGCDHGLIGIAALKNGIAARVVFIDISAKSLAKARFGCLHQGIDAKHAQFICQNGIAKEHGGCAVIAGLGGKQIAQIIAEAEEVPQYLLLQPMKNTPELRQKLYSQNFEFIYDAICACGGKFYDIILVRRKSGADELAQETAANALHIELGKTDIEQKTPTADFLGYLRREVKTLSAIINQNSPQNIHSRLLLVKQQLERAQKAKTEVENEQH